MRHVHNMDMLKSRVCKGEQGGEGEKVLAILLI